MTKSRKPEIKKEKKSSKHVNEDIVLDCVKKRKSKKSKNEEIEDDLSELDLGSTNDDNNNEYNDDNEDDDNDNNSDPDNIGQKKNIRKRKEIDPTTPIGELSIQEILSYMIKLGVESYNPALKNGSRDLLNTLTGNKPRYRNNRGTSRFPRGISYGNHDRTQTSRGHYHNHTQGSTRHLPSTNLYED